MNTNIDPADLAELMMDRSTCSVQVGAVVVDSHGIFGWGWNHMGSGFGEHAEVACIKRSNKKRMKGATLWVASQRKKNGKPVFSRPCEKCQGWIESTGIKTVYWRDSDHSWRTL